MKHPHIIAGRQGLPPTSDIGWSVTAEFQQRRAVRRHFVSLFLVIVNAVLLYALKQWLAAALVSFLVFPAFAFLEHERQILYAMLLNKPRDLGRLTQWTEHSPISAAGVLDCACGRQFILVKPENFFDSTRRFAAVCECGRGHFSQITAPLRVQA